MGVWHDISSSEDEEEDCTMTVEQESFIYCGALFLQLAGLSHFLRRWKGTFGYISDCSGMDAPLFALKLLFGDRAWKIKYLCNSDINAAARRFLQMNHSHPVQAKTDIFEKDSVTFVKKACLYVAGFPCTPFSVLHGGSKLLGDKNAGQLYEVIRRLKRLCPAAGILENVVGFVRVITTILEVLQHNLPEYEITWQFIDPHDYGSPITRRRVYILLIKRDLMVPAARKDFEAFAAAKLQSLFMERETSWQDLLLPNDHPIVQEVIDERVRQHNRSKVSLFRMPPKDKKWVQVHKTWSKKHKVRRADGAFKKAYPNAYTQITSQRELKALDLQICKKKEFLCINTSQMLHRMPRVDDGPLRTLTPNGTYLLGRQQRFLTGLETLLLMGLPIDGLTLDSLSNKDLHQMGGNSMAIRAVMAAISVVLSGLDPDLAQSYLNP